MNNNHLVKHIVNNELSNDNTLHIIGVISNPARWQSRIRLFKEWRERMLKYPNIKLYVVEGVYGDRQPECAPEEGQDYSYMTVNLNSQMWLKENLIVIGEKNLFPRDWKYMMTCDCDVQFEDHDFALATIHQLQTYNVVQPWSHALDLDFHGGVSQTFTSFGFLNATGKQIGHGNPKEPYIYGHTGFCVAMTKYFWENVGLPEWCIIGSGDHHFMWACVGHILETIHSEVNEGYKLACELFERRAKWASAGMVGYVHGRILHYFHGNKKDRQYWNRWNIILKHNFNPLTDLAKDSQGVLQYIGPAKLEIEKLFIQYNVQRREDSI
jgi:hypothetical protein